MGVFTEVRMVGIDELIKSIRAVRTGIERGSSVQVGRKLAREGLRVVKQLTPRQKHRGRLAGSRRGHPPFWRQWKLEEQTPRGGVSYVGRIYNLASREGRRGNSWGYIALASLEFGAKEHAISSHGNYPLAWREVGGQRRFLVRISEAFRGGEIRDRFARLDPRGLVKVWPPAQPVGHPGHRSFSMVHETREHLDRVSQTVLTQFANVIARQFTGLSINIS